MSGWTYAPEFSTPSLALHHKRIAPDVVLAAVAQRRGGWRWYINQHAKTVMHGDADTEMDAKRLAEDALRQWWRGRPRTLFNVRGIQPRYVARGSQLPVSGAMILWIDRHGPRVRGRDTYEDAKDIADELNLTTHQMLRLENAMREYVEGRLLFPVKPGIGGQRTLFNPKRPVWSRRRGNVVAEVYHDKEFVKKPFRIMVMRGDVTLWAHVSSTLKEAVQYVADYMKRQKGPIMLFNPSRGHKLRLVFEKFKKAWEREPAIFETEEEREDAIREAEELAHDIGDEHRMSLNNLYALFEMIPKYIVERERKEKQRRHPTLFNAGTR